MPIWVTEWALIDWFAGPDYPDSARQGEYAEASAAMMEELSIVERYAWFSLPYWDHIPSLGLYHPGPVATPAGEAYARAGG
ncbi:glycosyl hydrolase [Ammonicoccus fulvus]|uniref:Glycosyl hydrolase n=1 Tax=Ammonicoccus fulvus TaxID=3138240 RepID=A0ABZ3FTL8_9ACTN